MKYKTIKAKKVYNYLFDDCGNSYKLYNPMDCRKSGYFIINTYKDGFVIVNQVFRRILFPYHIQRKLIDFIESKYPNSKRLKEERALL